VKRKIIAVTQRGKKGGEEGSCTSKLVNPCTFEHFTNKGGVCGIV
jgi:hypothetical protein